MYGSNSILIADCRPVCVLPGLKAGKLVQCCWTHCPPILLSLHSIFDVLSHYLHLHSNRPSVHDWRQSFNVLVFQLCCTHKRRFSVKPVQILKWSQICKNKTILMQTRLKHSKLLRVLKLAVILGLVNCASQLSLAVPPEVGTLVLQPLSRNGEFRFSILWSRSCKEDSWHIAVVLAVDGGSLPSGWGTMCMMCATVIGLTLLGWISWHVIDVGTLFLLLFSMR